MSQLVKVKMYSQNLWLDRFQLALVDGVVVFSAALGATWLRHDLGFASKSGGSGSVPWMAYLFPSVLVAVTCVLLMHYQRLYTNTHGWFEENYRIASAVAFACVLVLALTFFYRGYSYSRATVLIFYPLSITALVGARAFFRMYRRAMRENRAAARRVLIIGFGRSGQHVARVLLRNPGYYKLVGFLDDDLSKTIGQELQDVPHLGTTEDLEQVVRQQDVDEILVVIPSAPPERIMDLVGECLRLNLKWKVVPNLCDVMLDRIRLDYIGDLPLISLRGSKIVGFNWVLKRAFDLTFATLVLILFAPVYFSIALLVKLTSKGPIHYKQIRIGMNGQPFTFLKLRSMRQESNADVHKSFTAEWIYGRTGNGNGAAADNRSKEMKQSNQAALNQRKTHKITRDRRVTPVGRLLRSTSLDEIPQFWNVLRGDMSVVGPRPPLPYEVDRYTEWHKRRLDVLPGITGLWQINGRNSLSFDAMVRLDIDYIETWTLEQDVKIVLKTIPALLFNKGY